ncbi:MAG: pentapeptide repeat-containing protein [Planctomycetota bacterium]
MGQKTTTSERTNLEGTILDGADLRGVDLSQVMGLTPQQLATAIVDETTILPADWTDLAATE